MARDYFEIFNMLMGGPALPVIEKATGQKPGALSGDQKWALAGTLLTGDPFTGAAIGKTKETYSKIKDITNKMKGLEYPTPTFEEQKLTVDPRGLNTSGFKNTFDTSGYKNAMLNRTPEQKMATVSQQSPATLIDTQQSRLAELKKLKKDMPA